MKYLFVADVVGLVCLTVAAVAYVCTRGAD
jgi:hypothetical protein